MIDSKYTSNISPDDTFLSEIPGIHASTFTIATNPDCNFNKFKMIFENIQIVKEGIDIENRDFKMNHENIARYLKHIVEDISDVLNQLGFGYFLTKSNFNEIHQEQQEKIDFFQILKRIEMKIDSKNHDLGKGFEELGVSLKSGENLMKKFTDDVLEGFQQLKNDVQKVFEVKEGGMENKKNFEIFLKIEKCVDQIEDFFCKNEGKKSNHDGGEEKIDETKKEFFELKKLNSELKQRAKEYNKKISKMEKQINQMVKIWNKHFKKTEKFGLDQKLLFEKLEKYLEYECGLEYFKKGEKDDLYPDIDEEFDPNFPLPNFPPGFN